MRYVVTGGCGFIGSHLSKQLIDNGHNVVIVDDLSTGRKENAPSDATLIIGDVSKPAIVQDAIKDADGIFHLAAVASVERCTNEWSDAHRTNVTATVTIFDAAAKHSPSLPVIYASSAAVYGDNTNLPLSETASTQPLTSYGLDKLSCEHYARIGNVYHDLQAIGLRFFNVYGPGQNPTSPYSGVITKFMQAAHNGQAMTIFGDGEQTRDFIFIDDIVALLIAAMNHPQKNAQTINGCTGQAISINQLAESIAQLHPTEIKHTDAVTGDIRHSLGDASRAERLLGFRAQTAFADGLQKTMAHFSSLRGAA